MKRGVSQYLTVIFLLCWAVASSPFLSILAISAHGSHHMTLSPQGGSFDVTFQHQNEPGSHSHDHKGDSGDHHAKVTLEIPTAQTQISLTVPEPRVVFVLPVTFESQLVLFDHREDSVFGDFLDRIDKPPASHSVHQTTVLLI